MPPVPSLYLKKENIEVEVGDIEAPYNESSCREVLVCHLTADRVQKNIGRSRWFPAKIKGQQVVLNNDSGSDINVMSTTTIKALGLTDKMNARVAVKSVHGNKDSTIHLWKDVRISFPGSNQELVADFFEMPVE